MFSRTHNVHYCNSRNNKLVLLKCQIVLYLSDITYHLSNVPVFKFKQVEIRYVRVAALHSLNIWIPPLPLYTSVVTNKLICVNR